MTKTLKEWVPKRQIIFWTVGPLLLLTLNFMRDLKKAQKQYEWESVRERTLRRGVTTAGVMEAVRVIDVKSEVDETVDKKMVQEGDKVTEGQPLIQLSRQRTQLEFEQKRNSHLNIESDYHKAVRELSVQKKLLRNMAVSRQQVEDAQQNVEKTEAALQISSQELAIAQKQLDSTLVRSPMNGVVLKDFTKLGQPVTNGKEIITVGDVSKFIVRAKVDELDIEQVRLGQTVEITADAFPGKLMKGSVTAVASQAEREAFAKVEVLIDIVDAGSLPLKHNLSVRVNIVTEDLPSSLSVPIKSIVKKDGTSAWVIVRNRAGFIRKRRITLGKTAGDRVQVISGLNSDEDVGSEKVIEQPS